MNTSPEMINLIPAMVYSWQIDKGKSTFLQVSDFSQELLGVSPQDALLDANQITNLILPEDLPAFSAAITDSMCNLTLFDCQVRMRRLTTHGAVVTVHFKSRPRRHDGATIWDGVAMEVDSSPAAPSSDAMSEDSSKSLPQHEETTKAVAAQQLVAAERNLTEWLSHEIRNPLSVTIEALQTLQELHVNCSHVQDNYSAGECYQVITESIRYVEDLLNNMNDLDQFDMGQMPVVSAHCTVREDILLPTYRMMKRLRPRGGLVQLRMAPGASTLKEDVIANVDKLRLRQVLTNLIANAFHFTTQGFVEVDLCIREGPNECLTGCCFSPHAAPHRMLSFHVRDSGCGVKPSQYDTLFSRWEELGTSRNGTGIGLCLCQALVKAMGGDIRLNKDYDSGIQGHPGAEFVVEVPVETSADHTPCQKPKCIAQRQAPMTFDDSLESALFVEHQMKLMSQCLPNLQCPQGLGMTTPTSFGQNYPPLQCCCGALAGHASTIPTTALADSDRQDPSLTSTKAEVVPSPAASTSTSSKPSSSSRKVSFFRGKYRFLIVDDEKMGRKFLKRRFSRLFPEATVVEVASGEEALVEAATNQYDVITMDHFMAVDEMNGDETIRKLRTQLKSDALIMGISGNDKHAEHLEAGADSFFQKPLPSDTTLIESLQNQLAPPAGWKALILSDDIGVISMLTDRLYKVASPHFTTQEQAQKRLTISAQSMTDAEKAIHLMTAESFDLIIMADSQSRNETAGARIRKHLRHLADHNGVVVIVCTDADKTKAGSRRRRAPKSLGLEWSLNALPSNKRMRQALCESLLSERSVSPPAKRYPDGPCPVTMPTGLPPKRSNSAKSA